MPKGVAKGLKQAYETQDLCFAALTAWRDDHTKEDGKLVIGEFGAQVLLQLVKAWSEAQDRIRIHRNKPLPGVLKHEAKPKRGKHAQVVVLDPMSESGEHGGQSIDVQVDNQSGNSADPQSDQADQSAGQAS